MSDFPKGGDVEATRAWLDKEGFVGLLNGWKAEGLMGVPNVDLLIRALGNNEGEGIRLWSLLNAARTSQPGATGGGGSAVFFAPPQSPRCDDSCFVLVDDAGVVIGTAFAVSEELLLTAAHCLVGVGDLFIAPNVMRTDTGNITFRHGRHKVRIVAIGTVNGSTSSSLDYGVLQLEPEISPTVQVIDLPLVPIPIYTNNVRIEDQVKCYYAFQAHEFNNFGRHYCSIGVNTYEKIASVTAHHIEVARGLMPGSSGGAYVMNVGGVARVVAIHIESANDIPDLNLTPKAKNTAGEILLMRDAISVISNTHTSIAQGLVIKKCQNLCDVLRNLGVPNM